MTCNGITMPPARHNISRNPELITSTSFACRLPPPVAPSSFIMFTTFVMPGDEAYHLGV